MNKKVKFVAVVFLGMICMFVIGAIEWIQWQEYKKYNVDVVASLASTNLAPENTLVVEGATQYQHTIKYSVSGQEIIATPYLSQDNSDELTRKKQIIIKVLSNNPRRIIQSEDEFSSGANWFLVGLFLFFVSIFALHLLRQEK